MLRAGRLLPPKRLSTPRFNTSGFSLTSGACYRAPWRLPGPDFHRQADTSFNAGIRTGIPPSIT